MRLIDADAFIKRFHDGKSDTKAQKLMNSTVRRMIREQQTAYDPDKVVEKLEEIRVKKTCNKEKCDTKELCRICVVDDAIEIVKAGGNADFLIDRAKSKSGERIPYDGKWK